MDQEISESCSIPNDKLLDHVSPDQKLTEEEFQNFMQRVTQVEKIVKKLASDDVNEQEKGKRLADEILGENSNKEFSEINEIRIKNDRTLINKISQPEVDPNKMSQEAFMRHVEIDARERAEDRKIRYERADTYKRIANGAFGLKDYEKAITYYSKAVEQRKDSALLWNNRALSYMRLGLYETALSDLEWALKVNDANIKALLNSAKCHSKLSNEAKRDEFLELARERNPRFTNYINDFEKELKNDCGFENTQNVNTPID
ncbi:tetratricopeptide repeat protein 12-like [Venturia canescens]|uniref:tetratricopeptide repeat protein 12-like n=1 Tax=Venturia canescens TaxID=32260 RepID=UPI001C9C8BCE|nr:tetratricopeptide repeat protein 12-like [Venturia canescens]